MALASGTRLGRYEIRSMLGAGGMGEVYRAADSQLKREVAIKVLPAEFAADRDRLGRFEQEAMATASLNHPHIVAVHDAGSHEGTMYVVTELLEGKTLKDVLAAGPVPLRKAADYARQIANGLAAAHGRGIVHRDLKPANLFVSKDDHVKIIDFGLARVIERPAGDASVITSTLPGTVLGSAGYMSPEQVRGQVADHRADIFSFGAVLYELVTGRRAFDRESVPGTLAAILHDDPPASAGDGTALSARLLRLARRCMAKDPAARFQSASDLMFVLSDEASDSSATLALQPPETPRRRSAQVAGVLLAAPVLLLIGGWIGYGLAGAESSNESVTPQQTFKLALPNEASLPPSAVPVVSRDGQQVAAVFRNGTASQLQVLNLATGQWRALPGTEGASSPFFSPDGKSIGFVAGQGLELKRVALGGGLPTGLCSLDSPPRGAYWTDDDWIVFGVREGGLRRVAASGGVPERVTTVNQNAETNHRYPIVLPGNKLVVFTVTPLERPTDTWLAISTLGSNVHRKLLPDGMDAQYLDGNLIYVKASGELHAVPFDPETQEITGPSIALQERPSGGEFTSDAALRVANNGTMVFRPFVPERNQLALADRKGGSTPMALPVAAYGRPRVSPDDTRLLFELDSGLISVDVSICDLPCSAPLPLTDDGNSRFPIWAADSRGVFHTRRWGAGEGIYFRRIDDVLQTIGSPRPVRSATNATPTAVTGQTLLYGQEDRSGGWDIWGLDLDGGQPRPLIERNRFQYGAQVSPSGKWLAYTSDEVRAGAFEVYVTSFGTPGRTMQVSRAGGSGLRWSKTDDELFFLQGNQLYAQRFTAAGPVSTPPEPAGTVPVLPSVPGAPNYDTLRDGRFIIVVGEPEPAGARSPVVILNWGAGLRAKK